MAADRTPQARQLAENGSSDDAKSASRARSRMSLSRSRRAAKRTILFVIAGSQANASFEATPVRIATSAATRAASKTVTTEGLRPVLEMQSWSPPPEGQNAPRSRLRRSGGKGVAAADQVPGVQQFPSDALVNPSKPKQTVARAEGSRTVRLAPVNVQLSHRNSTLTSRRTIEPRSPRRTASRAASVWSQTAEFSKTARSVALRGGLIEGHIRRSMNPDGDR